MKVATWNISGINQKPFEFENNKDYTDFFNHVRSYKTSPESIKNIIPVECKNIINSIDNETLLDGTIAEYFEYYTQTANIRAISSLERYLNARPTILDKTIPDANYWHGLISYLQITNIPNPIENSNLTDKQKAIMLLFEVVAYYIITRFEGWQEVRSGLTRSGRTDQIKKYIEALDSDIMFLQEANTDDLKMEIQNKMLIHANLPKTQISCILISNTFTNPVDISPIFVTAITDSINALNNAKNTKIKFDAQDLVVVSAIRDDKDYILASFHGDSTGAATNTVVNEVSRIKKDLYPNHILIFGMDANSGADALPYQEFYDNLLKNNIKSCSTSFPYTTYKTRTLLQTQIYKAGAIDQSVKDHILIETNNMFGELNRINAIDGNNNLVFDANQMPNRGFPADHLIVSTTINPDQLNPDQLNPDQLNPDQLNPDQLNPDQLNPVSQTEPEYTSEVSPYIDNKSNIPLAAASLFFTFPKLLLYATIILTILILVYITTGFGSTYVEWFNYV
jgi:hypothetical protein